MNYPNDHDGGLYFLYLAAAIIGLLKGLWEGITGQK